MFVINPSRTKGLEMEYYSAEQNTIFFFSANRNFSVDFKTREELEDVLKDIESALYYKKDLYIVGNDWQ